MELSAQSQENLRLSDRHGFDETAGGVVAWVERNGHRGYLHDEHDILRFKSVEEARGALC